MENRVSNIRLQFENLVLPLLVMAAIALDWAPDVKLPLMAVYWLLQLRRPRAFLEAGRRCTRRAARFGTRIARRWRHRSHVPGAASRHTRS